MSDLIITEKANITAVADNIRSITGHTGSLTLGEMATIKNTSQAVNLDEELAEQDNLIAQIQTALEGKAAGSGSSDEFVTGILQGVTTLLADPTLVTYYFDLENIPNLSSKNIIILKVNSTEVESVIAALYRENINNSFNLLIGNFSSGTYENPAIDGSIFSLQANTIDSLLYYAK